MTWWFVLVTLALFLVVNVVVEVLRRAELARQEARLDDWENWDVDHKLECLRELKEETLEREGKRRRNGIVAWALMLWFIPTSLWLIGRTADDAEGAADTATTSIELLCQDSRAFRNRLRATTQREMDDLVAERDRLGERIQATPADIREQFPGLADLPGFNEYLAAQITQAQEDLGDMNSRIMRLRAEITDLDAAAKAPCPPEGDPRTRPTASSRFRVSG